MLPDVRADLITILAWHVYIGKNETRAKLLEFSKCCVAIADGNDLEIRIGKRLRHETLDRRTVVSKQNDRFHYCPSPMESSPLGFFMEAALVSVETPAGPLNKPSPSHPIAPPLVSNSFC